MCWLYLNYFLTLFSAILIPIYWKKYGIQNFLWLSDVSLFLTLASLWTGSPLFISTAACGIGAMELVWNIDFFLNFIFHQRTIRLADYMFDNRYSYWLRGLSLFHIAVPLTWIFYLSEFGYDQRAIYYFTALYWIIIPLTYIFTKPEENINWVFVPQVRKIHTIAPLAWVIMLMICIPTFVALPTHLLLKAVFHSANAVKISG